MKHSPYLVTHPNDAGPGGSAQDSWPQRWQFQSESSPDAPEYLPAEAYREHQLRMVAHNHGLQSLQVLVLAGILISIVWDHVDTSLLAFWLGAVVIGKTQMMVISRAYLKVQPAPARTNRYLRLFIIGETIYSSTWASFFLLVPDQGFAIMIYSTAFVLLAARTNGTGAHQGTFIAGTTPITAAVLAHVLMAPQGQDWVVIPLLLIAQYMLTAIPDGIRREVRNNVELRAQKDLLIAELVQATAISDEARHRAEEASLAKSRFLATMSHELRTPLNAIMGFSDILKRELFGTHANESYRTYADDIYRSGEHLLRLINEILDISRIEAGRYKLSEEPVHLCDVARDCIHMVQLAAHEHMQKLVVKFESALPPVWVDERAMRQIFLNLLSNAMKFTQDGGTIEIKVGWTEGGGQYLAVRDNGPGIPEHEIPEIMRTFGQGSLAKKTNERGAGLGLPIVEGLIGLHGGNCLVTSRLGVGTTVLVTVPALRVMEPARKVAPRHDVERARQSA